MEKLIEKRTALAPIQDNAVPSSNTNRKQAITCLDSSLLDANKENVFDSYLQTPKRKVREAACEVTCLGDELKAVRKKMERMKLEKEGTEKLLQERETRLESEMNDMMERCEFQKILELEVDRLYRLKQLHSQSMRISPMRSLREKARERRNVTEIITFENKDFEDEEGAPECDVSITEVTSPSSSSSYK